MTAEYMVLILGGLLIGLAFVLSLLPIGECPQCPHCRLRKAQDWASNRQARHSAWHARYGKASCPYCAEERP